MKHPAATVCAVMVHVSETREALAWYRAAFPEAQVECVQEFDFEYLQVGQVRIELAKADEKVSSGPAGSVVYWEVDNFQVRLKHLLACGAVL